MKVFGWTLPASLALWGLTQPTSASSRTSTTAPPPLKVFLLVGQSNMQGQGYITATDDNGGNLPGTLDWMVETDPAKYGKLRQPDGNWTERPDVWIAYNRQSIGNVRAEMNQHGPLIAGYGGYPGQQGKHLGPELGLGWTLGDALNKKNGEQILFIKVAWGGRSLAENFRPPSSGGDTGLYYESMIAGTLKTLTQIETLFPDYAKIGSYELAGFFWHQGLKDGCHVNMTKEYEFNLANLIRDVRQDLGAPNLPVSIGVSGQGGWHSKDKQDSRDDIVNAQFAVADPKKYPEFAGTVASVETRNFGRPAFPDGSPGKEEIHWNNNCETYWLIGKAMAEAMAKLLSSDDDVAGVHT